MYGYLATFAFTFVMVVCSEAEVLEYCSFFNNRAPKPQPTLRNCTWFKENSCCMQEEIAETFGQVKSLPGASPACQQYTNYLMCYICAPYQNFFYKQENLWVCEEFCDAWYGACGSAILKGSRVNQLYTNGRDFCKSRSYKVNTIAEKNCFFFDKSMDTTSGQRSGHVFWEHSAMFVSTMIMFSLVLYPL
ncbi:riboflavin-binding protein-like [Argopecten irradians]|uniref:riboflavin-binding protein-like n=1 Tax=Argopecten irradians TaxID=31199 RepID=UPI0037178C78